MKTVIIHKRTVIFNMITIIILTSALLILSPRAMAYELIFGDVHSHTSFSDGEGVPADAFTMARDEAGLGFWTVSDHLEQVEKVKDADSPDFGLLEWDVTRREADKISEDGKFVGMASFEWGTDGQQGHMNVLNAVEPPSYTSVIRLKQFYKWVYKHPETMTGFNHPSTQGETCLVFNNMEFVPPIASQTVYIATNVPTDFHYYYLGLDNGWRLAPMAQQDNHRADWGMEEPGNLTGLYVDSFTRDGVMAAFAARRFYATNNRAIRLWIDIDGQPMGSTIETNVPVTLNMDISTTGAASIALVKLISNGEETIAEWNDGEKDVFKESYSVKPVSGDAKWYVVYVEDGDGRFALSAPVWVSGK